MTKTSTELFKISFTVPIIGLMLIFLDLFFIFI